MQWQRIATSRDLAAGGVLGVEIGDLEIVLWRSSSGELRACDARCPHQWAHLGAVGAVDGEELVCLSHFWRFDSSGAGSKLAMNGRRDEKSPITTHPVRERDGGIEILVAGED